MVFGDGFFTCRCLKNIVINWDLLLIFIFGSLFRNRDTCSAHSAINAMQNMNQFLCFQVRDRAVSSLVEIYRHVGERVRLDLSKKGIPQPRYAKSTQPAYCYLFTNVCQLPLLSCFCTLSHPEQTVFVGGVIKYPPSGRCNTVHP